VTLKYKLLTILIIFTLTISLIPDSNLYASEDLLPFEYGSILVEFRYKGEINEKHKQPEKKEVFSGRTRQFIYRSISFLRAIHIRRPSTKLILLQDRFL